MSEVEAFKRIISSRWMMNPAKQARDAWMAESLARRQVEAGLVLDDPETYCGPLIPPLRALSLIGDVYEDTRPAKSKVYDWIAEQLRLYRVSLTSILPPPPPMPWKSASALMAESFPPIPWIARGFFPQGLVVLGGKPKLGKSFMVLNLAVAVATGSEFLGSVCEAGDVLYLALEDTERRLQDRLGNMAGKTDVTRLDIVTRLPDEDPFALKTATLWAGAKPNPRLVIVDVLQKVRPATTRSDNSYAADYAAITPWKDLADRFNLCVVLIHHTRKMPAEDPIEALSGTNGLTGAADCIMVLDRSSGGVTLVGRGRDVEEFSKAVRHDRKTGRWILLGDGDAVFRSDERTAILDVLHKSSDPMGPKDIAEAIGAPDANVRKLLGHMCKDGQVTKQKYGKYAPCDHTDHTDHTGRAAEWTDEPIEEV